MRIVFMGTPDFAVPSLVSLVEAGNEIALVVTRPDAVRGRGKKLEPSPVKAKALELGLPVVEANRMTPEVVEALKAAQADIFCVAAYGCILPDDVLHMAPLGIVNVHASLLPRWRGAAPIQRAILAGDEVAGVSIMRIGHGVDTGAYCAQASTSVAGKHAEALTMELGELGRASCLPVHFLLLPMVPPCGLNRMRRSLPMLPRFPSRRCVWIRKWRRLIACVMCWPRPIPRLLVA